MSALKGVPILQHIKQTTLIVLEYAGLNYRVVNQTQRFFRTIGFTKKRQLEFILDFSTWLNDECSPVQACHSIIESGKSDPRLALEVKAAESIYGGLKKGLSISEGLEEWFDSDVVTLFSAGQKAGAKALTSVVNAYLKQEDDERKAKKTFWEPIKQPFFYQLVVIAFMLGMGAFVLPKFSELMHVKTMTSSVDWVINIAQAAQDYYLLVGAIFGLMLVSARHIIRTNTSTWRLKADAYFPLNIYRNFAAMKMMKMLGILVETRYNLHRSALEIKKYSTRYQSYHLNHIIRETQFGESNLADALNSGLFSTRLMFRLRNAANSSNQSRKKSAISIAADRSGDEALRALVSTRIWIAAGLWISMSLSLLLTVSAFMGLVTSLLTMSHV
jgi:type II secretory pathway component PulF